ncbi:DNA/RNA helicase [Agromyces bauzanensis]
MTQPLPAKISRAVAAVRDAGGVARTPRLAADGHSPHVIARAVAAGALLRVRRGWVAQPQADRELVEAARAGVVLTCVTQARRLGLWVLAGKELHVGAPAHAGGVRAAGRHVHWAEPMVPRNPDALVDPIENVLALVAACQPRDPALAVWESALRKGIVTLEAMRRLDLGPAGRALCAAATPWSDSGLESFVVPRLRWLGLPIVPQAWLAGHRVDFLIGDRLVLQIDGGHHAGPQRDADNAHDADLMLMGNYVVRVGYVAVVERWHEVQDLIMRAIAQGLHRAN